MTTSKTKEDVWIKTFCHGCLSATCGIKVHRVNGVVVGIEGDPDSPYNHGRLCSKAYAQIMTLYDPYRPSKPLVRTNPEKGIGVDPKWKEVSWEEALSLVAQKLDEVRKTNPGDLCLSTADISAVAWVPGVIITSFGTRNWTNSAGYYCATAIHTVPFVTMGCFSFYPDFELCNYLVLWGSNKGGGVQHVGTTAAGDLANAHIRRGAKLVCIDPVQSNIAAKADEWVPLRPGTDLALALAWLHVLLHETGLYDAESLKKFTNAPYLIKPDGHYLRDQVTNKPMMWDSIEGVAKPYDAEFKDVAIEGTYHVSSADAVALNGGSAQADDADYPATSRITCRPAFQLLKEHVKDTTPAWAAPITTLPAEKIRRLAKEFGTEARIGSTIKFEGHVLPFRPAAIHWGAGISQHHNGYATGIALQLINTVVGNLQVPGGLSSSDTIVEFPLGTPSRWTGKDGVPGECDGLFVPSLYQRSGGGVATGFPPTRVQAPTTATGAELFPVSMSGGRAVFEMSALHPERFNNKIPRTKVLLTRNGTDLTSRGNPEEMAAILKDFFQISCEPLVDETTEFADVVLPVPSRLERLQIGCNLVGFAGATVNLEHHCINLSQPVVEPAGKEMLDIWVEIAERLGFLDEFNQIVNIQWDLQGEHRLETGKKYSYHEMQERLSKSLFGSEYDLKTLGEAGHVKWRKSVRERYPRVFLNQRSPIYYEHFIDAGKQVSDLTRELGFDWDVRDYQPLPAWRPSTALRETEAGFDLLAIPFRVPMFSHMWLTHNPWLEEMGEVHPWAFKIVLNADTAAEQGIQDGDHIVVESTRGYKVEGKAKLTQCIHPEVVALSRHGGHWARHPIARGKGTLFNTLLPMTTDYLEMLYGGLDAVIRVKITRLAGNRE